MKNTDTAGSKGYDAGKKVSGIKRHIGVDTQGLPHAIAVTTAEVTDRRGALQAMQRCKDSLGKVQSVLADSGYVGEPFARTVGGRTQLCLAGEKPALMEKLRALAQHQLAVHSPSLLGNAA